MIFDYLYVSEKPYLNTGEDFFMYQWNIWKQLGSDCIPVLKAHKDQFQLTDAVKKRLLFMTASSTVAAHAVFSLLTDVIHYNNPSLVPDSFLAQQFALLSRRKLSKNDARHFTYYHLQYFIRGCPQYVSTLRPLFNERTFNHLNHTSWSGIISLVHFAPKLVEELFSTYKPTVPDSALDHVHNADIIYKISYPYLTPKMQQSETLLLALDRLNYGYHERIQHAKT